ncbi:MAG: YfiR family protein [Desulfuromonadaceae bacterium]
MKFCSLCIVLFFTLVSAGPSGAAQDEFKVKAAMFYNFAKFVEWPANPSGSDSRITYCIAGKSRLTAPMQDLQGKLIKGKSVFVREIDRPADVAECQVLFIAQSEKARLLSYLHHSGFHSILTVSDLEQFAESGGMIGFSEEDNKIRFDINQEAAKKQGLRISSHLLNLGRRVLR